MAFKHVQGLCNGYKTTKEQGAAMVILVYNVGSISGTRLIANHREGKYEAARKEFDHIWITDPKTGTKRVSKGLVKRRC